MTSEYHPLLKAWKELRFLQLFVFSLLALLLQSFFYQSVFVSLLVSLLYLNIMYVAFSTTGASKKIKYFLFPLWIIVFIIRHFLIDSDMLAASHLQIFLVSEFLSIFLLIISIGYIFRYVLFSKKITTDILFASMVNYLLIAMLFARIYATIDFVQPHSFSYSADLATADGTILNTHFSYFSIVTIATLGYGDIVPLHPVAQTLAAIEAVVGQFYVAMIVAWLVSMHVLHNSNNRP